MKVSGTDGQGNDAAVDVASAAVREFIAEADAAGLAWQVVTSRDVVPDGVVEGFQRYRKGPTLTVTATLIPKG